jgi:hypothetical protein
MSAFNNGGILNEGSLTITPALVRSGIVAAFIWLRACPCLRGEQADGEDCEYFHNCVRK